MTKKITLLLVIAAYQAIQANGIILGDQAVGSTTSFSFNLLTRSVFNQTSEYLYVAARDALEGDIRKYGIAGTTTGAQFNTANSFVPLTPETITLNGVANVANPLYGVAVTTLGIAGNQPVVTITDSTNLYWFNSKLSASTVSMLSSSSMKDAAGNDSAGPVLHAENSDGGCSLAGTSQYIFAAVKPNGDMFGNTGGGIALFKKNSTSITQEKSVVGSDAVIANAIQVDTAALKIGASDLGGLETDRVDLCWDETLQRLYIGVSISDTGDDGGRSVIVAYLSSDSGNTKLNFVPIAAAGAFSADTTNELVGATSTNALVKAYRVRVMHTSTGLSYLIIQGGSGSLVDGVSKITFYAVPLVNEKVNPANAATWQSSSTHGTVAKATSTPVNYYATSTKNGTQYLAGRGFDTPATAAGDLVISTSFSARIGGGDFPGTVSDVQVYKDTVFVSSKSVTGTEPVGVFYSQALFDADGKIIDWTPWQRLTYHLDAMIVPSSFAFVPTKGQLFTLEGAVDEPTTIRLSVWGAGTQDGLLGGTTSDSSVGLIEQLNAIFPQNLGGIQGLFDFDNSNPAFAADADNLSLLVATGYKKVAIIKSALNDGTTLNATIGDFTTNKRTFTDGALDATSQEGNGIQSDTKMIIVSGGDLDLLGPISCATIVEDPTAPDRGGYLAVGGVGGVALLRNSSTRAGWAETGLVNDLSTGLGTSLAFDTIGNYSNVRKLWTATTTANAQALYILTDTALYRIDAANLDAINPTAVTLATIADLGLSSSTSFADFIASKRLGLLATSAGLYRTGNGKDISTATSSSTVGWQQVILPESYTGISQLIPLSTTMLPYQFADGTAGQVYYIASSVGYQNAAVNRLAIRDASASVNSSTVQTVSYPIVKNSAGTAVNSPLSFLGAYRSNFGTNGASLLVTSPAQIGIDAQLNRLPVDTGNGRGFSYLQQKNIDLGLGAQDFTIAGLARSTATGSWLVYGDFGLRVLE